MTVSKSASSAATGEEAPSPWHHSIVAVAGLGRVRVWVRVPAEWSGPRTKTVSDRIDGRKT